MHMEKKNRIQSVEVAFSILNAIAENSGGINLNELSLATQLPKNQLYRYLNSFVYLGVLTRNNQDHWTLGPQLVTLGNIAIGSFDLTNQTLPYLISLRDTLNETVVLSVWKNQGPFFIHWEKSNKLASIVLDFWSVIPLHVATGKIYRAFMPESITNELYQQGISEGNIVPIEYSLEIEQIKKLGLSVTKGTLFEGISALSSPIFYASGQLAGAITIAGVLDNLDVSLDSEPACILRKTALEVSQKLGYKGEFPPVS